MAGRMRSSLHPALVFAAIFAVIFLLHAPLLRLPYFWDEAGYYVPAAHDLLQHPYYRAWSMGRSVCVMT